MKRKSILYTLLFALGLSVSFSSCEDMLTVESDRNVYQTGQDTLYSYWGVMKSMQKIAERYVILGETRGDLISPSSYVTDTINDIAMFKNPADQSCRYLNIKDYYAVINNCNCYLAWADTNQVIMNNQKMMIKEYAQVSAIRAWTYMQLVNTYGTVPFYTEPLTSLSFVDNFDFNQASNRISHEDIADKLVGQLLPMIDVPYPSYGNYDLGSTTLSSKLCFLPLRVVIADLYLMQNKYEQAAQFYYDYFKETEAVLPITYNGVVSKYMSSIFGTFYSPSANKNKSIFSEKISSTSAETVTVIPGASNPRYGQVLPGIAELYGYNISTSVSSSSGEYDSSQNETTSSSSSVMSYVTMNYKKQLNPSEAFQSLGASNLYCEKLEDGSFTYYPGDARLGFVDQWTVNYVETNFISKCSSASDFLRFPVIYRKALIWLRFAEAINRAGFPSYAYAILKDGLCDPYIPRVPYEETRQEPVLDEDGNPMVDEETGEPLMTDVKEQKYDSIDAVCYYIPRDERLAAEQKPYMDFSSPIFSMGTDINPSIQGIHKRGGGQMQRQDNPLYTYDFQVKLKLEEKGELAYDANGNWIQPSKAKYMEIVEELIVDELALETGFEGNRFPDLIRFANHKDLAGENGKEWLADKIGLRNFKLDTEACEEAQTNAESEEAQEGDELGIHRGFIAYMKEALRQKNEYRSTSADYQQLNGLLNQRSNWFLPLPAYK
ncbi:MAG: hypothetical protein NC388_06550 [Clostridium sp.]|nr:hypothetical protein [Clostridium sp.]